MNTTRKGDLHIKNKWERMEQKAVHVWQGKRCTGKKLTIQQESLVIQHVVQCILHSKNWTQLYVSIILTNSGLNPFWPVSKFTHQ